MQEIKYEDGTKTKKTFKSFEEAIEDARRKSKRKPIKELKITKIIPSRKRKRK